MGKRKTVWPTDREIRLRFMLFAVIDVARVHGVAAELLLNAHTVLRDSPTCNSGSDEATQDIADPS